MASALTPPLLRSSNYTPNGDPEKTPPLPEPASGRRESTWLKWLVQWPFLVILGQLILLSAAWGFFGAVQLRGFIPLRVGPYEFTSKARAIKWAFNYLAFGLAFCSSYLFSFGVGRSIALHLHTKGMTMGQFFLSTKISSRSIIRERENKKWSLLSIALFALASAQTPGWSDLIMPGAIQVEIPLSGYEIDLSSSNLLDAKTTGDLNVCMLNSSRLVGFSVGQTASGYAKANSGFGNPTSMTMMDQTFNISTGGILPFTLSNVDARSWFPDMTVIPTTANTSWWEFTDDLPPNYLINQQGFTADVTCNFSHRTPDTTPSLSRTLTAIDETIASVTMNSSCAVPELFPDGPQLNYSSTYAAGDPMSYLSMIACPGSGGNFNLIFGAAGLYAFMDNITCTFAPQITRVLANYSDGNLYLGTINTGTPFEAKPDVGLGYEPRQDVGPAGLAALVTIYNIVFYSQAPYANIVADQLDELVGQIPVDEDFGDAVLHVTENYLRGVAEYGGSVFRACLSGLNGTFNGVPPNMRIDTREGQIYFQLVGWQSQPLTFWVLLPLTIIALITIAVVLTTVGRYNQHLLLQPFDPSDPKHLVSAAAAGKLGTVFTGTEEDALRTVEEVKFTLQPSSGHGLVFLPK
ncbi:hypothetical protein B0H11DRAFT_2220956 [Mycena galericulata]|nr:hypothetical protein B0H11DRAFT_2220956 [Mycena galericulata]